MSEEWRTEELEWTTQERKVLKIAGEEIDVTGKTAEEVKRMIIEKARELGWAVFRVLCNGEPVPPAEFESRFNECREIEVVKKDVAG